MSPLTPSGDKYPTSPIFSAPKKDDAPPKANEPVKGADNNAEKSNLSAEALAGGAESDKGKTDALKNALFGTQQKGEAGGHKEKCDCPSCKNRRYECSEGPVEYMSSDDTEHKLPEHEEQHLVDARAKAEKKGLDIASQHIELTRGSCNECGKSYISAGKAVTHFKTKDGQSLSVQGKLGDETLDEKLKGLKK